MPIPVVCPTCATKLRAPDNMAGRNAKCPKCGTAVAVPSPVQQVPEFAHPEPPLQPVKRVESPDVRPKPPFPPVPTEDDFDLESCLRRRLSAAAAVSNTVIVQQPSRAAHSLGVAALVIGVLAFFVCWIPFLGIAVSGLGLLLGLAGLALAIVRRGSGVGFSIAGSSLSTLSLIICLIWTAALSSAFTPGEAAVAEHGRTNHRDASDQNRDKAPPENQGIAPAPRAQSDEFAVENFDFDWTVVKSGEAELQVHKDAEKTVIVLREGGVARDSLWLTPADAEAIGKALEGVDSAYTAMRASKEEASKDVAVASHVVTFRYSKQYGFSVTVRSKERLSLSSISLNREAAKAFTPHLQKAKAMAAFVDKKIVF